MFKLDHVIVAVSDLDTAMADYRALGFTVNYGGKHASGATHNALICFQDGVYLELIAALPGVALADNSINRMLQRGEGLVGYAVISQQFQQDIDALRAQGVNISNPSDGGRTRADGVELRWRGALIDNGGSPFLLEDVTPRNLRVADDAATVTHANGVTGVAQLEGADLTLEQGGNQTLTGLVLTAPEPLTFASALTHNVALTAV
jgi:catechol 2,3-dioxygenase-like lactoylglutathione lyase family enzyme